MDRWCLAHLYLGVVIVIRRWKKVNISRFCAWKIIGKYIWNLTNPNTIPIITKKSTNTCPFKDPKYKYNDKYANSQNDKHKYDNFWVFGVWNTPKLWYPNIFVSNYAGPWWWVLVAGLGHMGWVSNSFSCFLSETQIMPPSR